MAEAKRRSEVKKFKHVTDYPQSPLPSQRKLLDATLGNADYDWVCSLNSNTVPPYGSIVIVRIGRTDGLEVLWGNQVVASVTDTLGIELIAALRNSKQSGGITASVVIGDATGHPFAIRFIQDVR